MNERLNDLAHIEKEKYRKVWEHPEYRKVSPGEMEMQRAFITMGCREGESLNDYGCGTARATKWFQEKGLTVVGIDHAVNAVETDVPISPATLWDMYDVTASDYGFCCDVMEHIPPEMVHKVLREISERTRLMAWFRIATRPDVMGERTIGEPLHLTIQSAAWWEGALTVAFRNVEQQTSGRRDAVFLVSP